MNITLADYKLVGGPFDGKLIKTLGNPELAFARKPITQVIAEGSISEPDFKNFIYQLEHGSYHYKGIK